MPSDAAASLDAMSTRTRRTSPAYRCTECGWSTAKWVGRCGECQAWGTVAEVGAPTSARTNAVAPARPAVPISEVGEPA